ncbi:double-strand break repair protein MRE11 family protein [Skeletonema marinoi]|uniref:Double-strand break repair protein MRE11 family protein n=1 Tax=Skeletonema marinoi TaxID=267567 RepID=A0AAD8Y5U1_9STRA|nr:double-strand break repair protein MRE11 family protein [Skeletonema marinoi]
MPPRRRARGRAAAAPAAEESSDSEPEQQQQPRQPDDNVEDDEPQNTTTAAASPADNASETSHHNNSGNNNNDNHPDENTLRILLSTDNHLGYLEKDPIRGNDSFAALEEVLSLARLHKVDLVLLSGDLFHDNKPSRRTLYTTMEILRRYCMGGEAVNVQIVSDQKECLRSVVSGRANYEDEFYSVDLPIFTIHGNHDDPTRDGSSELLSAIDLLSVSNLLNYFGRQDAVDNVQVSPILLQKGGTKVALYGMGSMRDERLNRMWQGKKVRFLSLSRTWWWGRNNREDDDEEEESRDWFNIFTLHQNRDLGRGSKNCVHESMIPEWMDLVVWGHEHECNIEPAESLVGTFRVTQPGSSVATSLTAGEARRKQVGILDIRGQQFRLLPVPLSSVRAFAVGDVNLGEIARSHGGVLDVEDPKVEERMGDVLAGEVEALIQKARDEAEQLRQDAEAAAQKSMALEDEFDPDKRQRKYTIKNPEQVLVRLKVEHSGFTTLNNQRFGSRFVGEVANPSDILLFHKRRSAETAKKGASKKRSLNIPTEPDDLDEINIEDLITDNLEQSDKKLELLDEKTMGEALNAFVDKEERKAIDDAAEKILKENRKLIKSRQNAEEEETSELNPNLIREMCANRTQEKNAAYLEERETQTTTKKKKKAPADAEASAKKRGDDHDSLSDDSDDDIPPPKKSRTTTAKKPAKSRKKAICRMMISVRKRFPNPPRSVHRLKLLRLGRRNVKMILTVTMAFSSWGHNRQRLPHERPRSQSTTMMTRMTMMILWTNLLQRSRRGGLPLPGPVPQRRNQSTTTMMTMKSWTMMILWRKRQLKSPKAEVLRNPRPRQPPNLQDVVGQGV